MKTTFIKWALPVVLLLAAGCKDKEPDPQPGPGEQSFETQAQNLFAMLLLTDSYRWDEEVVQRIEAQQLDYTTEKDPVALFDGLLYPYDRWSMLTDDFEALDSDFSGTSGTFGYSLQLWLYGNSSTAVFGIVTFVYPGSPAEAKGIERGDLIVGIDGQDLTTENYLDLYYAENITLEMGEHDPEQNTIGPNGETVALTARVMYQDPIQYHTVLEEHGRKIGYLCYTNYIADPVNDAHGDLLAVFQGFKDAGVEDVVLDLRYNGGGYAVTSDLLCDILAPQSALDSKAVMIVEQWNDAYTEDFGGYSTFGYEVTYEGSDKKTHTDRVVNMDLDRVYILTTGSTASASESTIVGLKPYMDVIQIGEATGGKFCGGWLLDNSYYPSSIATETLGNRNVGKVWNSALDNWGAYVMIYEFTNVNGDTFENGFIPDAKNAVEEDLVTAAYPFGDTRDPMLGRALELITGYSYNVPETRTRSGRFTPIPAGLAPARPLDGRMIDLRRPH